MPTPTWLMPTFEWIWKTSWQASVLVGLLLLVQTALGRRLTAGWRYGLWLLVVARLIAPVLPETRVSVFNWVRWDRASAVAPPRAQDESGNAPAPVRSGIGTNASVAPASSPTAIIPSAAIFTARPLTPRSWLSRVRALPFGLIWLGGAGVGALFFAAQFRRFQRRLAGATRVDDGAALRALSDACATVGLEWSPAVYVTPHVNSPALFGFGRPRLLLPEGFFASLRPEEIRHVFLHEAAHLKRGDMPLNWLLMVLQAAHWFNPVLWLAFARLRADRELACDELVLSRAPVDDTRGYAQTIIKLLEDCSAPQALPGLVGILEDHNHMKRRIAMITKYGSIRRWRVLAFGIVGAIGLVALTDAQAPRTGDGSANKGAEPTANAAKARPLATTLRRLEHVKYPGSFGATTVSPDGRYLVYGGRDNEIALCEIATQTVRPLGKAAPVGLCFSADSSRIAYLGSGKVGGELRTMNLEGGDVKTIMTVPPDTFVSGWLHAWSLDGKLIAVGAEKAKDQHDIAVISTADGTMRVLRSTGNREPRTLAFSPDSRWLVYDLTVDPAGRNSDLFIINLETGEDSPLVTHKANDLLLGWSPASNRILFSSDRRGTRDAWTIACVEGKAVGEPMLVKADLGDVEVLGVTNAGALYFAYRQWTEDVFTLTIDPETGRAVGPPVKSIDQFEGENSAPQWSPDGYTLAYSSRRSPWVVCLLDVRTQHERTFDGLFGTKWSPDGKRILSFTEWDSPEKGIFVVDVASGERHPLAHGKTPSSLFRSYQWSHDGRSVYYQYETSKNNTTIVRRNLASGREQEVQRVKGGGFFALSPDGESLAYKGGEGEFYVMPAAGGESKLLFTVPKGSYVPGWDVFSWSADSRAILVCKWQQDAQAGDVTESIKSELLRVPIATGEMQSIVSMPRIRYPHAHPDGTRLSFSAGQPRYELWMMDGFLPDARVSSN